MRQQQQARPGLVSAENQSEPRLTLLLRGDPSTNASGRPALRRLAWGVPVSTGVNVPPARGGGGKERVLLTRMPCRAEPTSQGAVTGHTPAGSKGTVVGQAGTSALQGPLHRHWSRGSSVSL